MAMTSIQLETRSELPATHGCTNADFHAVG